jgi:hypothetical protein
VAGNRVERDPEPLTNLSINVAARQKAQHLDLPRRK